MKDPLSAALCLGWTVWFVWGYVRGDDARVLICRGFFALFSLITAYH